MKQRLKIDSDKEKAYALFFFGIFSYFLKFILTIYLTHHLTPAAYGDLSIALTLLAITTSFALLGTNNVSVKFLPHYLSLEDMSVLENFLSWIFKVVTISFITCLFLSVLLVTAMFFLHALGIKDINSYDILMFVLWITPFAAFALLLENFILSNNHPIISYILQNDFARLLQLILFFTAISILQIKFSNLMFTVILILCYVILIIIGLFVIYTENRKIFNFFRAHLIYTRHKIDPEWKAMAFKVILTGLLHLTVSGADLFILRFISPHRSQVGMYAVVWIICNILLLVPQSIYTLVLPKIGQYTRKDSIYPLAMFQKLLNKINGVVVSILVILALTFIILGKPILLLFGPIYMTAYAVLVLCTIAALLSALSVPAGKILFYSSNINILIKINIFNLMMTLLLGSILTYYYTIIGISITCLIVHIVDSNLLIYFSRKKTSIRSMIII